MVLSLFSRIILVGPGGSYLANLTKISFDGERFNFGDDREDVPAESRLFGQPVLPANSEAEEERGVNKTGDTSIDEERPQRGPHTPDRQTEEECDEESEEEIDGYDPIGVDEFDEPEDEDEDKQDIKTFDIDGPRGERITEVKVSPHCTLFAGRRGHRIYDGRVGYIKVREPCT